MNGNMLLILFWLSLIIILYTYLAYPLFLVIISLLYKKPKLNLIDNYTPSVSLIVAAFNEEKTIREKIINSLNLNYPKDKLEIIVFSDGSTDKTDEIVKQFYNQGVKLYRYEGRMGKTKCQNMTIKKAIGEIIVFSDNSIFDKNAILEIVKPFSNKKISCVGGQLKYIGHNNKKTSENIYWKIEKFIKKQENKINSNLGVSGGIYAVRKENYIPLPADIISDFAEPLMQIKAGFKVAYAEKAICYEKNIFNAKYEFNRKVRTILRGLNAFKIIKGLLNPFKYPLISFQLISHKILRWKVPILLILLFGVNIFLIKINNFYFYFLYLQLLSYILAILGIFIKRKPFSIFYYFCLINLAALKATIQYVLGKNIIVWDTKR